MALKLLLAIFLGTPSTYQGVTNVKDIRGSRSVESKSLKLKVTVSNRNPEQEHLRIAYFAYLYQIKGNVHTVPHRGSRRSQQLVLCARREPRGPCASEKGAQLKFEVEVH